MIRARLRTHPSALVRVAVRACGAALLAAAGTCAADAAAPATPATKPTSSSFALKACRLAGLEHDALCGVLKRPLDPTQPGGPQIDLHVAVIPALARQKLPDPVFFFAGGPGQSAIDLAGTIERLLGRLGARRDLVLIDQRGTGRSAPLQCDAPSPAQALARALDRSQAVTALDHCRAALQQRPWGDLRQYTTTIAMADADAVRDALGAERINLMGVSYGTRAALEYLRLYPTHVRRVVLDAVAPPDMVLPATFGPDMTQALDVLFRDCAAEPACAAAHPQLDRTWQSMLASLPRRVTVDDPTSGAPLTLTMTREVASSLARPALYVPALAAGLPQAIESAAAGRFGALIALSTALGDGSKFVLAEGQHFAVICSEDAPRLAPLSVPDVPIDGFEALYRDVCPHWPRGTVPPAFYTVTASPAPVLLLSGALDPVTPPRHAARVARALGPQAVQVVVPNAGHGVSSLPCVRDAVIRFVDAPLDADARAVDFGCAATLPRPPAFRPPLPARGASAPLASPGFAAHPESTR